MDRPAAGFSDSDLGRNERVPVVCEVEKTPVLSRSEVGQIHPLVAEMVSGGRTDPPVGVEVVGNTLRLVNPFTHQDHPLVGEKAKTETKELVEVGEFPPTSEQGVGEPPPTGERAENDDSPTSGSAEAAGGWTENTGGSDPAKWLHSILPVPDSGHWEVRAEGKGFSVKFRWHVGGKVTSLTFPRISAERYQALKENDGDDAKRIIGEGVTGHLDDLTYEPDRAGKARLVAARLGIELDHDQVSGE